MIDLTNAPFPVTYRELWLPGAINGNATLPSSRYNGHGLALTGARKGTTADGVHFYGDAASNINCGAIHNAAAKMWVSFRFKLDQDFAGGVALQLFGKILGFPNDLVIISLAAADGKLHFQKTDGGVPAFNIASAEVSWNAEQWYHVIASISDVNGARLIIDNGTPLTDADVSAVCNGGDFVIGDEDDPGAGNGFQGIIADFVCGTATDLTVAEEAELYKGIPKADAVNFWPLDEGRGVTVYDRGSGSNNGTIDTSPTWAFGQVQQPVISLDCIDDHAQSSAGIDISGDLTVIWAGKMKSTYDALPATHVMIRLFVDGSNYIEIAFSDPADAILWYVLGSAVASDAAYIIKPTIDDYLVLIGTLTTAGVVNFFVNGQLVDTDTGAGVVSGAAAIAYIGRAQAAVAYDISKPLLVALIEGAFSQKQARAYSRWLKNMMNLPISI